MQTNQSYASIRDRRIELSRHARQQMQRRGITVYELDLIRQFGTREHDGYGAIRYLFDKKAERRCTAALRGMLNTEHLRGKYLVESVEDEDVLPIVITASQRR